MKLVTLTVNPALDKSSSVELVLPDKKLRCDKPKWEPGGGGINVSRALKKLGTESIAYVMTGGAAGEMVCKLLEDEQVHYESIPVKSWTRENLMVVETSTGNQYRFGMPGDEVKEKEWKESIKIMENLRQKPDFLVASGSLAHGMPTDYYAQIARICDEKGIKMILDTSGEALKLAVEERIYLIKPNLRELKDLVGGDDSFTSLEQEEYAEELINSGKVDVVALSLGNKGIMAATKDRIDYIVPPTVKHKSSVGAGDSMVGGMLYGLEKGFDMVDVFRYGVAAGTAATMTPGTELCRKEDAEKIFKWLKEHRTMKQKG